ncbi:hypothetical protein A2955_02580 [Candidatus Woesebacteria bacterium RIFCSPLOWO2_01_FULL_37_19]|uniref:Uncharacterized protein n=2 Tax=Candidatus Woeseibacteriota TaxID=1752722 RepID=A0A1F8AYF2_9BACT|nr:MAG: hypothetical protein A2771_04055 [Candidatus Woesebacteria bacterium RIFCSPHIGHO2_01_FULL_38_26b]OGM56793.1 MAG: hypothetical protein A2955_02580 [Candidatus Woesebacteria bacterium RIFCSPLOWO2_01_FULL_37_19]
MNPFGNVAPPSGVNKFAGGTLMGLPLFITVILRTLIVIAGVYTLINIVVAGLNFMSASGDPKRIQDAWAKIWQTVLGLAIVAGAFVIAAIVGLVLFQDATFLLRIKIFGP